MQDLKDYLVSLLSYQGRFNRRDFIYALLAAGCFALAMGTVSGLLLAEGRDGALQLATGLVVLYANACSGIKRMHDLDQSPWLLLLLFVPFLNIALLIYLLAWPSKVTEADRWMEREGFE